MSPPNDSSPCSGGLCTARFRSARACCPSKRYLSRLPDVLALQACQCSSQFRLRSTPPGPTRRHQSPCIPQRISRFCGSQRPSVMEHLHLRGPDERIIFRSLHDAMPALLCDIRSLRGAIGRKAGLALLIEQGRSFSILKVMSHSEDHSSE